MTEENDQKPGWPYYAAIVLFVAVLGFAVLGLVRSTSRVGAASDRPRAPRPATTPSAPAIPLRTGRVPTPQIPPPVPSAPTEPPSRTYLFPAPERATTPPPEPDAPSRR
ncbi:MAG TPA: hypothetical protein VIY96_10965 [Thermoanaerobaculia bacterium]